MNARVIPFPLQQRVRGMRRPHPSLGPCTDCGSEDVRPLTCAGDLVAVRCTTCGWIVAVEELARLRAVVEGVAAPAATDGGGWS